MEAPASPGVAIPVPPSQAARKEWRAIAEHSFRNNGGEKQEHVMSGQSAERTIYEVQEGTGSLDVDFCSITIDSDGELNDDVVQQRLQEITRQKVELQQMEIGLRARVIARSEILEVQKRFEVQLKGHANINANLKEQLHEREQHMLELEMRLEEKDRELRAMKIDSEAAWAKEDLLREQTKELATFRRERDNSEAERMQHLNQIRDLQGHIHEKESQFLALQEQHRVAQETILFKDEQLREAQAWIAHVQEMDALQSSTNQSLQAEIRERTEQFNQYWMGFQRQFDEMERHHIQAIQQLQLELAEAREKNGSFNNSSRVSHENLTDPSAYNGNQINVKDSGNLNGHLGHTSNANADGSSSYVSVANPSTKTEHVPGVPVVRSSIIGMNTFISPGQMAALHPYLMNPQGVPQTVASTTQPHMGRFQSIPIVPTHQHWQNQQVVLDNSRMPNQSKYPPAQTEQDLLISDAHYSFSLPGEIQIVHADNVNNHRDQQLLSNPPSNVSSEEVLESVSKQCSGAQQTQEILDASSHVDSARELDLPDEKNEPWAEDIMVAQNQSQEQMLKSGQQWPTSSTMLCTNHSSSVISNSTEESTVSPALVTNALMPGKPPVEPNLLDERSLLVCIVRAIPAGSVGRIRISTTLPNRLAKMLAPLHWHDYKKHYGKLDDFVARHPELFVIEGDFIHLCEGAQQIISATSAVAKVAAAVSSGPHTSLLPSVAVTPVSQISRQKKAHSIDSKAANTMPFVDGPAMTDAGDSSDKHTHILTRPDQQPNGVSFHIMQCISDVTISSKLKNVQEANGLLAEIKPGHSSINFKVGNAAIVPANLGRTGLSPLQNKGLSNGRHSFGGKLQVRSSGAGLISRR